MKATEIYLILCQMDAGEITLQEAHELILSLSDTTKTEKTLPFDFVMWYSGMREEPINNAYKRYLKEVKPQTSCSCDNGLIVCPGCDDKKESEFGVCAGCKGIGMVTCGKCGGKNKE
jgi:hypothetical protein